MNTNKLNWIKINKLMPKKAMNCHQCYKGVAEVYILELKLTESPYTRYHVFGHKTCLTKVVLKTQNA